MLRNVTITLLLVLLAVITYAQEAHSNIDIYERHSNNSERGLASFTRINKQNEREHFINYYEKCYKNILANEGRLEKYWSFRQSGARFENSDDELKKAIRSVLTDSQIKDMRDQIICFEIYYNLKKEVIYRELRFIDYGQMSKYPPKLLERLLDSICITIKPWFPKDEETPVYKESDSLILMKQPPYLSLGASIRMNKVLGNESIISQELYEKPLWLAKFISQDTEIIANGTVYIKNTSKFENRSTPALIAIYKKREHELFYKNDYLKLETEFYTNNSQDVVKYWREIQRSMKFLNTDLDIKNAIRSVFSDFQIKDMGKQKMRFELYIKPDNSVIYQNLVFLNEGGLEKYSDDVLIQLFNVISNTLKPYTIEYIESLCKIQVPHAVNEQNKIPCIKVSIPVIRFDLVLGDQSLLPLGYYDDESRK